MNNFLFFEKLKNFFYFILKNRLPSYKKLLKIIKLDLFIHIFISREIIEMIKFTKIHLSLIKKLILRNIISEYNYNLENNLNGNIKNKIDFFSKNYNLFSSFLSNSLPIKIKKKINIFKKLKENELNFKKKNVLGFFKKKKIHEKIKKAYHKKFVSLFDYNLPEFQQYQGYFNSIGKRIKKFSMIWDQTQWILFLFVNKKYKFYIHRDIICSYLDNLFMILMYIETGKVNNFFFTFKKLKFLKKEHLIQLFFFYKVFTLERKWNVYFSQREKINSIYQHLSYTSDSCIDDILYSNREYFSLNTYDNRTNLAISKLTIFSYVNNTKVQLCLIDLIDINRLIFKSGINQQFFFINKEKIYNVNKKYVYIQKTFVEPNCDFRLWHTYCFDSYLFFFQDKIKIGIFLIFLKKTRNFFFDFLLCQFYKSIFQLKKKDFDQINFKKRKVLDFYNKKSDHLLKKLNKRKIINQNFQINSFIFFSKKKFVQENKIFFTKIFKHKFSFIFIFLFKGLYCIGSYWYFYIFNKLVNLETNTNINEILLSKFYNLFICHEKNPFVSENNRIKVVSNCICFLQIYNQTKSNFSGFICIYFSVAKKTNFDKAKKFKILLLKKRLIDVVVFFCAKYKVNFIILESNSFLERSISVFLKIELFKQSTLCNRSASNCLFRKRKNLNYIQLITLEKNTIIFNIANSNTIRNIYPDYTKRILFLVLNFLDQNIIAYSVLFLGKKFDINLKINQKFFIFKYDRLYKILSFVFFFIFSQIKININYILKKKEKRNLLSLLNVFGRRKGYKFCKRILNIFKLNKNHPFELGNTKFLKIRTDNNWWIYVIVILCYKQDLKKEKKTCEKFTIFYWLSFFKKNIISTIFNNPLIIKDFKKVFINQILRKNFNKSLNLFTKCNFYKFLNECVLTYSSSNFLLLNQKKYNKLNTNYKKKIELVIKPNLIIRSWKEKILLNHRIGQILIINSIKKFYKNYFWGMLKTGFCYFINQKDFFEYKLNFKNFIKNKISFFPAKIVAIYPSIMKVRLSMVINKKHLS
nr:CPARA_3gp364 [Cryptomonas curvata]